MRFDRACLLPFMLVAVTAHVPCQESAGSGEGRDRVTITDSEFNRNTRTDDLVMMLVQQLGKTQVEARDAASKLAQVGKSAVPVLADLVERGPSDQVKYYAAVALSRVRHSSAAEALLPLINNAEANRDMRMLAIDAAASNNLDKASLSLAQLAGGKDDAELRQKALVALSVMPIAWRDDEDLFVRCLSDPDGEIRSLAVKVCFYAAAVRIVYGAAEPRLLEMVERDEAMVIRCQALRALARMKSGRAVALCVQLLEDNLTSEDLRRQALATILTVTEVPLRDDKAVQLWWDKYGKARYANAPPLKPFTAKVSDASPEKSRGDGTPKSEETDLQARGPDAHGAPPVARTPDPDPKPAGQGRIGTAGGKKRLGMDDDEAPLGGVPMR